MDCDPTLQTNKSTATTPPINKFHVTHLRSPATSSTSDSIEYAHNGCGVAVLLRGGGLSPPVSLVGRTRRINILKLAAVFVLANGIGINGWKHNFSCKYFDASSQRLSEGGSDVPSKIEPKRKPSNSQTLTAQTERVKKSHCSGEQSGQLLSRCKHKHVYCCTYMLSPIHDCHRAASEKGPTGNF
ncbi:hypothetical protein F2P81_019898 [Scophthalmus maximus]|uniref:Uncharacterized protein n=1 Tax=Scophthalmus maximus TaxID=52904 RepID=A0A6A4S2C2_SCOMX|nr:hypothetical protein F2P81_019898 [Scophthalmus maximus]